MITMKNDDKTIAKWLDLHDKQSLKEGHNQKDINMAFVDMCKDALYNELGPNWRHQSLIDIEDIVHNTVFKYNEANAQSEHSDEANAIDIYQYILDNEIPEENKTTSTRINENTDSYDNEEPKITAYSIAQFEAERLDGRAYKKDNDSLFNRDIAGFDFNFRGRAYKAEVSLTELGSTSNSRLKESTYIIKQNAGPFGVYRVCEWEADSPEQAVSEFLDMNPSYKDGHFGKITAVLKENDNLTEAAMSDQEVFKTVLGWYKQQIENGNMTLNQCYELLSDKAKVSLNKMVDQSKIKESLINKTINKLINESIELNKNS